MALPAVGRRTCKLVEVIDVRKGSAIEGARKLALSGDEGRLSRDVGGAEVWDVARG